jgi:hypothetical protein
VRCWADIAPFFAAPPAGYTNTVDVLKRMQADVVGVGGDADMTPLIIHLFTDGTSNRTGAALRAVDVCWFRSPYRREWH